jgi:hypothetical protein
VFLGVCEGGVAPFAYGGKVSEEHVYTACSAIHLLRSTLDMGDWSVLVEEWGCRIQP